MERKLIVTEDGSHTLYVPELQEHFHSTFGSIQEALHIFINAGLKPFINSKTEINILEIGFGTGLNALLTYIEALNSKVKINYTAIEAYPVEEEIFNQLNFSKFVEYNQAAELFTQLHNAEWEENVILNPLFELKKIKTYLHDFSYEKSVFDIIYFDAFAPDIQPEMWEEKEFEKLYHLLKNSGILVTYSCKGNVKRALKSAGFEIEKLPGPKGKREFLKALKTEN